MACKDCAERRKNLRDAILHGRMAEAMDMTVDGLRVMMRIDAGADHRKPPVVTPALPSLSGKTKAELLDIADDEGADVEDGATNPEIIEAIDSKRRLLA
jgi:hypothetical protein